MTVRARLGVRCVASCAAAALEKGGGGADAVCQLELRSHDKNDCDDVTGAVCLSVCLAVRGVGLLRRHGFFGGGFFFSVLSAVNKGHHMQLRKAVCGWML